MKYVKIELPDDFEKGCCYDCPFSYEDPDNLGEVYCIFGCGYFDCPLEIEEE